MKKLRYLFIFLALLLILSIVFVSAKFIDNKNILEAVDKGASQEETADKTTVQEGLEKVKNIVGANHGSIEYKGIYEIAEKELYWYKDNLYEYYIDSNTKNFVGMIMIGELPFKKEAKRINKDEALEIAKNFSKKCFENFFDYDVEIKVYDYTSEPEEAAPNWFSIRFEQKNESGTYTGYYIDMDVDKYGEILFYHAIEGNYEVAKQKPEITREEAIDIVYREAEDMVKEIIKAEKEASEITVDEKAQAMGWADEPIPPGDSGVYFDTEPVKFEEFKANLDERGKHKVTAELSVAHNKLEWVIYIDNVEINRDWSPMGFSVIIDAIIGEILTRGHTE
ncbi:MAG: hypothetical protein HQ569_08760 [Actinobacteria bacterium]|nr:hypothetical protein [Actinomycetota bacterium]